jgi:hypothetical protein
MSRNNRIAAVSVGAFVVAAAVVGGLVACQGNPSATPETTPTASQTTSSPSASPSADPEAEAVEAAENAMRDYYRVTGLSRQNPEDFNVEDLKKVAITSALIDAQSLHTTYLTTGTRTIGDVKVEVVKVHDVDLTNRPKAKPQPVVPEVQLMVCVDATDVNVVDKDGKSLNKPGRQTRNLFRVGVVNYEYPDGPWLTAYTDPQEGEPC